ncbi:5-oxoprolinase subunit PxpA [Vibrio sp. TRT 17S01]|uniref:5-oxoprolinase subunit PxpA n=1 Tax=Vibrio sp. TRT 17S01 TaxID=3418505 RepID=UPI003CF6BAE2
MKTKATTLNCDMGESFGIWSLNQDSMAMRWIDMANIACGFHASDPQVMYDTIALAIQNDVKIGAHPGYPDLQGFGRRTIPMEPEEITNMLVYQIGAIKGLCEYQNTTLQYVKPHGALYNDMMRDLGIFEAVCLAVSSFGVPLMMLAIQDNERFLDIADKYELPLLFEAFADRAYLANGTLASRKIQGSLLQSEDDILNQVKQIVNYGKVHTLDGYFIPIEADTICVHSDNESSVQLISKIKTILED